ncbi:hypothetical protein N6B72_16250 [Chryseobacterium soli]|nr:hypothetical protein [Chryseobacterium soli]MDV7698479.1 hypothetical protein [Chryseobacterium soli]
MKKLKRNELKEITGAGPAPIYCALDGSCPSGLCCSNGTLCKDPKKYPCI